MLEPITTPVHRCRTGLSAMLAGALTLVVTATPAMAAPEAESTAEHRAQESPRPRQPASGPLRIDVDSTVDDADLLREWIRTRNASIAEEVPLFVGHEQWIAVEIGGATYDYTVSIVGIRDGKPLGIVESQGCVCTSERLLEIIDARISMVANTLREPPADPTPPEEPPEDLVVVQPPPGDPRQENDRPRRLGAMGYVGITTMLLGTGALGTGIQFLSQHDEPHGELGDTFGYTVRPPGITLAAGGSVAIATGITLLVVDAVRHRKRSLAIVPTLAPRHAGLSVTRRF